MTVEQNPSEPASPSSSGKATKPKRTLIKQTEVPSVSLEQALRVPRAIAEHYAFNPTKPLHVASGMEIQQTSGTFRSLTGAAIACGLVKGGYNAPAISITPLGMRIVRPSEEGDDLTAQREAFLRPRIIGEFLRKYNNGQVPRADIAANVLHEMGVPLDRTATVFTLISEGAEALGFVHNNHGRKYFDVDVVSSTTVLTSEESEDTDEYPIPEEVPAPVPVAVLPPASQTPTQQFPTPGGTLAAPLHQSTNNERRVFITHGKNRNFIEPIKKLLQFGELEPVVAAERQSVSQPVLDKVMGDMRSCGAAIIHVDAEQTLLDREANEHVVLNPNVLMEIGAAMALYGRRVVLLVREGAKLPSNLQGVYEVRYKGESLDGDTTIRLLEAIRDIKNHPLPNRYTDEEKNSGA